MISFSCVHAICNFAAQTFAKPGREITPRIVQHAKCIQKNAGLHADWRVSYGFGCCGRHSKIVALNKRPTSRQLTLHVVRMMQSTLIKSTRQCPKPLLSRVMFHLPLCHDSLRIVSCMRVSVHAFIDIYGVERATKSSFQFNDKFRSP